MCFTKRKRKQKDKYKDKQKEIVKKRAIVIQSKEVQPKRTIKKITP
tara:strand:+ start:537 stop:674 length:138 start_codon:yes stop_codon:yes gene_type:complete